MTEPTALQIDPLIDVERFTADISENQDDISEAMRKQTGLAAFYGMQHAKAKKQAAHYDLLLKTLRAKLAKRYRQQIIDAEDKPTVSAVNDLVETDNQYLKIAKLKMDADEVESICRVAYEAFRTRRDMLTGLGHLTREQMRGQLLTTEASSAVDRYRNRRQARKEEAEATTEQ